MLPVLTTPRLLLRPLSGADVPALFALLSSAEALRYWGHAPFTHPDEAAAELARAQAGAAAGQNLKWGVVLPEAHDRVIGTGSLFTAEPNHRRAEIGFLLAPALWGQGYGGEVVDALIRDAFGRLGLCRLEADVDPRNTASLRVLERRGFVREGYLRARYRVGGEVQDSVLLGLLRDSSPDAPASPGVAPFRGEGG